MSNKYLSIFLLAGASYHTTHVKASLMITEILSFFIKFIKSHVTF